MESGVLEEFNTQLVAINKQVREWLTSNEEMIKQKVPEYLEKTKNALQKIWNVISYDPAILEWGLVGLAIGGKKWAVIVGGLAHMGQWAKNLAKALGMASAGLISMKDIAEADFKELEKLVKKGEELMQGAFFRGKIPARPTVEPEAPTTFTGETQIEAAINSIKTKVEEREKDILKIRERSFREQMQALDAAMSAEGEAIDAALIAQEKAWEDASTAKAEAYQAWYDAQVAARESLKALSEQGNETFDGLRDAFTGWASSWSQTLNDMVWGAETSFSKILESFGRMITQMIIQKAILRVVGGVWGAIGSAAGEAAAGGGAQHGAIVTVAGESRPEAIMPLARTSTGDLGIKTEGGGGGNIFNINIAAVDARSFAELTQRNPQAITGPVVEALRAGGQFRNMVRSAIL
jgi:hypothetical protein